MPTVCVSPAVKNKGVGEGSVLKSAIEKNNSSNNSSHRNYLTTNLHDLKSFYLKNLNDNIGDNFTRNKSSNLVQPAQQLRSSNNGGLTYKKKGPSSALGLFKKRTFKDNYDIK